MNLMAIKSYSPKIILITVNKMINKLKIKIKIHKNKANK